MVTTRIGSKGFLETHVGVEKTTMEYANALLPLTVFLLMMNIDPVATTPARAGVDGDRLDEALVEWSDMEFLEGSPASLGDKTWAALVDHWPQLGRSGIMRVPRFFRCRKAWSRLSPGATRVGMPWPVVMLVIHFPWGWHGSGPLGILIMFP